MITITENNPENQNQRLIRAQELNISDFVADSVYWYLNEKQKMLQQGNGPSMFKDCQIISDGVVLDSQSLTY